MVTINDILLTLWNDPWFIPSKSDNKATIIDNDGQQIEVAKSYYHSSVGNSTFVKIRVSEHGTYLETWLNRRDNPTLSLQNLSVVFSDLPIEYSLDTLPRVVGQDEQGKDIVEYTYFVVEQYVYMPSHLSKKDFDKVISKIKTLCDSIVFNDPLLKQTSKKASRKVLTPNDTNGNKVPSTTNAVHPRQTIVANNKDNEVDAKGNVLPENKVLTESHLRSIIRESIMRILNIA